MPLPMTMKSNCLTDDWAASATPVSGLFAAPLLGCCFCCLGRPIWAGRKLPSERHTRGCLLIEDEVLLILIALVGLHATIEVL